MFTDKDEKTIQACADLVGRSGGTEFELGYTDDDPKLATWWAHARYRSTRIQTQGHAHPSGAARALAERLLTGARCQHCHGLVSLADEGAGAGAFGLTPMADGTRWDGKVCRWRQVGARWTEGCR